MPTVRQQDGAQITGGGRGVDVATIALTVEQGYIAAVVQMCVRQNDRIDIGGGDWQRAPVAQAQLFVALKQPAAVKVAFHPGMGEKV